MVENGNILTPAKQYAQLRDLLMSNKASLQEALPKHITPERMLRVVLTSVRKNPKLLSCDQSSFMSAILTASQMGLECDGVTGQAYLIPFRNNKKGIIECQFMPGYRGLIDLARRSGQISTIYARVVHELDKWCEMLGTEEKIEHVRSEDDDPGPPVRVYAVCRLKDGGTQFESMSMREIEAIRERSRSANDGPWVTDWEEMAKKTVLRRLCKMLPLSVELRDAVALDEAHERGISQDLGSILNPELEIPVVETVNQQTGEVTTGEPTPEEKAEIERREKAEASGHAQPKRTPKPAPKTTVVLDPGLRSNGEPWDE